MKKRVCIIIEENKFKEVSNTVWVCWKAMILEKAIKTTINNYIAPASP